jgi:hypothetical protein
VEEALSEEEREHRHAAQEYAEWHLEISECLHGLPGAAARLIE